MQAGLNGVPEMRDEEIQEDAGKDKDHRHRAAHDLGRQGGMVQVTQAEEAGDHAEHDIYRRHAKGNHQAAHQAIGLRILEQERVEAAFEDHDEDQDGDGLFDILLDVRGAVADPVAVTQLELLKLDDRRGMGFLGIMHIVQLVMPIFILFGLDRFAQLVGIDVDWRVVADIVADRCRRRGQPSAETAAHVFCAFSDLLLAFAPLVRGCRIRGRQAVTAILLCGDLGELAVQPQIPLGALALQPVIGKIVADLQRLDFTLASNIRAPAHSILRHATSS